jgi:hypothetical protein
MTRRRRIVTMRLFAMGIIGMLFSTGVGWSYPANFASPKMGARVICQAKLVGNQDPNELLSDAPVPKGRLVFAKEYQKQVFVVDLGQERVFDRVDFGTAGAGEERNAKRVRIEVSSKSLEGPYKLVFEKKDLGLFQVLRLPKVRARWVKFDLGEGSEGALVHGLRIYKGYEHPRLDEVTRLLYERTKPGIPGLEEFYKHCKTKNWKAACAALRAYCAKHYPVEPPDPKIDLSRQEALRRGELDFAGIKRIQVVPIDWAYMKNSDWYEHKNFLNRGSPIGAPVDAAYNTGDIGWARYLKAIFYDWIDANPKPEVMSGADYPTWRTLDTAARAGWLTSRFARLTATKHVDDELWANWLYSIWEHADYLKNDNFTGGNWLAHSTSAVMGIAMEFPFFADRPVWLEYGKTSFERNVLRDVYPDGKEMEDAPGYVCFAYNAMLGTLQALDEAGISVDPEVRSRLNRTQDFLAAVTQPDGNMPAIGDWGGGPAYPLPKAIEYFKREDIKYVWTRGKEGKMPEKASVNFPHGQWSIMRSRYEEKPYEHARHLVFKTSRGSHGHDDVLQITAYAYGRELLIDPGIRSYERADVILYPHTSYHNTITIDGQTQPRGPGKTTRWVSNDGFDYVLGSFDGYEGLTHTRGIVFVKPDYWVVVDQVEGKGEHTYDQNWHFPENAGLTENPTTKAVHTTFPIEQGDGYEKIGQLMMLPVDIEGLTSEPTEFLIATNRMGSKEPVKSRGWKYSRKGSAPVSIDLVLYPYKGSEVPQITVSRLVVQDNPSAVSAIKIARGEETDYVIVTWKNPQRIFIPSESLEVDAEVAVIRCKNGKVSRLSGASVRSVSLHGEPIYTSSNSEAKDVDLTF